MKIDKTKIDKIFTFILIPGLTLLLSSYANIFTYNFSYIGNELEHRVLFDIWGISVGLYFHHQLISIYKSSKIYNKKLYLVTHIVWITELIAVILPYSSSHITFLDQIHELLALVSSISFAVLIEIYIYMLYKNNNLNWILYMKQYNILLLIAMFIFFILEHVTSLLEIYFTLMMCFYLYYLKYKAGIDYNNNFSESQI